MEENKKRQSRALQRLLWLMLICGGLYFIFTRGVLNEPPIHQFEGEEQLSQSLPASHFEPHNFSTNKRIGSKIYSLNIQLDSPTISPVPGTQLKGSVTVTGNGLPTKNIPKSLWGKSGDYDEASPRIYIKTYGILDVVCAAHSGFSGECVPQSQFLRLTDKPEPVLNRGSLIYSPQARFVKDSKGAIWDEYLAADTGRAEFTINYKGSRSAPYLVVEAYTDNDQQLFARRLIYFEDQESQALTQPENFRAEGLLKYQVSFAPNQITSGKPQLIKGIVSAQTAEGKPLTENFQRVRIWAEPIAYIAKYDNDGLVAQYRVPQAWHAEYPGFFVNSDVLSGRDQIAAIPLELMREQVSTEIEDEIQGNQSIYYPLLHPEAKAMELDLVSGKGEFYYWYTGKSRLNDSIRFITQPINFDYEDSPYITTSLNNNLVTRYDDDLPGDRSEGQWLYGSWLDTSHKLWSSFNTTALPFTSSPVPNANRSLDLRLLAWMFVALHLIQLVGGGLLVVAEKRADRKSIAPAQTRPTTSPRMLRAKRGIKLGFVGLVSLACLFGIIVQSLTGLVYLPRGEKYIEQNIQELERRADIQIPGNETGWRIDVAIDGNRVNPQPGSVTNGRIRITDKSGRTVPVSGGVAMGIHAQNRGGDYFIPFVLDAGGRPTKDATSRPWNSGRIAGSEPYGFVSVDLNGESASSELTIERIILRPYFDSRLSFGQFSTEPSEDTSETGAFHNPYQNIVWVRNGIGEFDYINYTQGKDRITFEVLGYELEKEKTVWAHLTKFLGFQPGMWSSERDFSLLPGTPENIFTFGSNKTVKLDDEVTNAINGYFDGLLKEVEKRKDISDPKVQEDLASRIDPNMPNYNQFLNRINEYYSGNYYSSVNNYDPVKAVNFDRNGFLAVASKLQAYGGMATIKTFLFDPLLNENFTLEASQDMTKLGYYYQVTTNARNTIFAPGKTLDLKLTPRALPGYTLPTGVTNHIKLAVSPTEPYVGSAQYYGEDIPVKYPAGFVLPGSSQLAPEIELDMGTEERFVTLELTDNFPLNQHIQVSLTGYGVSGYPEYLKYNPEKLGGIQFKYESGGSNVLINDPTKILRADNPEVIKTNINVRVGLPSWQNLWIYWWYPTLLTLKIIILLYTLIRSRRRRGRT